MSAAADWEAWEAVPLPVVRYNFWSEPYAELYDWYPWMRVLYTPWEINHNCLPVRVWPDVFAYRLRGRNSQRRRVSSPA